VVEVNMEADLIHLIDDDDDQLLEVCLSEPSTSVLEPSTSATPSADAAATPITTISHPPPASVSQTGHTIIIVIF